MNSRHFLFAFFVISLANVRGQLNSWIKPASGNWEEPQWSLGVLPGAGQAVMITNAGWKAVAIAPSTVQTQPHSLNVDSLAISSPPDTRNVLLMNFAGLQVPLTVNALTVASNSALEMHASALRLNGPMGVGLSIGGDFSQQDLSLVTGNQIDIGYIGPGVYDLVSGVLEVGHEWVGGAFGGVFNQRGGSNSVEVLHLETNGVYNFLDGEFKGEVYFNEGSLFRQQGGVLNQALKIWRGHYLLENGINRGGLTLPVATSQPNALATQTGGTNLGPLHIGEFGRGTYVLSNGVVSSPSIDVRLQGHFAQHAGAVGSTGTVSVVGGYINRGDRALASYTLDSGTLSAPGLFMDTAQFTQNGGLNRVAGELRLGLATHNFYRLNGGTLRTLTTTMDTAFVGGFYLSGGTHVVTNQLTILGTSPGFSWDGYVLSGGELVVSNLVINGRGKFLRTGGRVTQSGVLTMLGGRLDLGPGEQSFGRVQLGVDGGITNSDLYFPSGITAVRFPASSAQPWSALATLTIRNWTGSVFGNGLQQIYFGNNAAGLSPQQLTQILFENPPGLPPGLYAAKLLDSGELVPGEAPPTGRVAPRLELTRQENGTMLVVVDGEIGNRYSIETTSNLLHWVEWTNGVAANGTFSAVDADVTQPARHYRALLLP